LKKLRNKTICLLTTENTQAINRGSSCASESIQKAASDSKEFAATSKEVSLYSQEQASATQEIASSAQALTELAEDLYKVIGQFSLGSK